MNRRSFLAGLAKAFAVAVAAPVILREAICAELPKAEPCWGQTERMSIRVDEAYEKWVSYWEVVDFKQFEMSPENYMRRIEGHWK